MQTNTNYEENVNITIIENRGQNFQRLNATVGRF